MFYALAICVCLAVWFLTMAGAFLLGLPLRRLLRPATVIMTAPASAAANVLFAVRTLPLLLALVLTMGLALPAFLRFEPHATSEVIGTKLWLLAAAGALVLMAMALRGARMLRATSQVEKNWRADSHGPPVKIAGARASLYCVDSASSLLAVTGFFRPRVFVAREVVRILSPGELSAAVAHEMAHVRRFDNLKQFLLKITQPPRWLGGPGMEDSSWTSASEVAADEGALAHGASALDLAAALVKIAALRRAPAMGDQIAASHLLPDLPGSSLQMRVLRLQEVLEGEMTCHQTAFARGPWNMICLLALPALAYVAAASALLPAIHEALELLVR